MLIGKLHERQLWSISGPGFVLPISVSWSTESQATVRVGCGLALLKLQYSAVEKILDTIGRRTGNKWECPEAHLNAVAKPCDHDDPEQVVYWMPQEMVAADIAPPLKCDVERFALLNYMVRWGVFKTIHHADVVWHQFCRAMVNVMLKDKLPVDMIFAKLYQFPYRRNWKERIASARYWFQREPSRRLSEVLKFSVHREQYAESFGRYFQWQGLFAWNGNSVRRCLESVPTAIWHGLTAKMQKTERPAQTVWSTVKEIRSSEETLKKIYVEWLEEMGEPSRVFPPSIAFQPLDVERRPDTKGAGPEYRRKRSQRRPRNTPRRKARFHNRVFGLYRVFGIHPHNIYRLYPHWDAGGLEPVWIEQPSSGQQDDSEKISNVLALPDLQPYMEDMRNEGGEMVQSIDPARGTVGMSLCDGGVRDSA